ncbi:MAG: N-formylglutamate amidohydrolase [Roseibium sp.]|uniref:N-formylglutamate amidohydrolase n=1 Tax=Roseibium sp. TaxID=1936156 RepID=UPI002611C040|nr:N-formylglutamate amidohydrolase [Roseibium sp.]MCV0429351.1 N-formylglutamate amidohydrolase [Roseibium sp.]
MIQVEEGQSPLILCLPHSGTEVPPAVARRFNATGRLQVDLSWRLERVFDLHEKLDTTMLRSTISRFVVDLDHDPDAPADENTGARLCPFSTLDGKPIYHEGEEPGPTESEQRKFLFFDPFHHMLRQQIDRLLKIHRNVVVLDCQSLRSNIRGVTNNGLPLVSIGTRSETSCDGDLRNLIVGSFTGQDGYSVGVDTQTQGGFVTQSLGEPAKGVHALSLLLAQRSYLRHESPPFEPDKIRIARLQTVLVDTLSRVIDWTAMKAAPGDVVEDQVSADEAVGDKSEVIPVDLQKLPKARQSDTGKVEDEPVAPHLVAE